MHADILFQIAVAILSGTICAFIAQWLRQPVILGYVAAGALIGTSEGLGWVNTLDIEPISELGLILLLFMIGLEIDLKKLRQAGKPVVLAGVGQFLICLALGLGFVPLLGFHFGNGSFAPLYLAVCGALSSTMIVVKLLYDKFELDTITGRITLGILVFQDIWAILFLALQHDLKNPAPGLLLLSAVKGIGVVVFALLVSRFILPALFRSIAKVPELMLMGTLGWCFAIVMLASALGLSREMGALIAGVAISTFPYNLDAVAKIISLRDFFITLFFVALGTKIPRPSLEIALLALAFSAFVMISRFVSVMPLLYLLRFGNRASFIPALNLAQVSEFSLVICALGITLGHISESALSVMVLALVITSVASTYGIVYSHSIFLAINPIMKRFGLRDLHSAHDPTVASQARPIVFLGFARNASSLLHEMLAADESLAEKVCVVDFNPVLQKEFQRRNIQSIYGDIGHADTLHHAAIADANLILSTIPDSILRGTSNARILRVAQRLAPEADIIVTAEFFDAARDLYQAGASFVFIPRLMGAQELFNAVLRGLDGTIGNLRTKAINELQCRAEVLP
jgi:Kef-type K+ transport system membrane component KefB